jgi:hypothetical protein
MLCILTTFVAFFLGGAAHHFLTSCAKRAADRKVPL